MKFFQSDKDNNTSVQIAKYLVSYMNSDFSKNKGSYKFIFNNLNIRNITHSQVLFSKSFFSKIFRHLNKDKKLHKYKDMYQFTKAYNTHNIIIDFKYENNTFADGEFEDNLIIINQKFNDKINEYKSLNNTTKFQRVKLHYKRFINRHNDYFKKMVHYMEIEFVKENITLNIDLSRYVSTSLFIYKKLKKIDTDIQLVERELSSYEYQSSNDFYTQQETQWENMRLTTLTDYVAQDIILENIQGNKYDKYSRMEELVKIIDTKLIQYQELKENQFIDYNTNKLQYLLMAFEHRTFQFREDEESLEKFKDFSSEYYYAA